MTPQQREYYAFRELHPELADNSILDQAAKAIWDAAWEAALNLAIDEMPGGDIADPQFICDILRSIGGTRGLS